MSKFSAFYIVINKYSYHVTYHAIVCYVVYLLSYSLWLDLINVNICRNTFLYREINVIESLEYPSCIAAKLRSIFQVLCISML